MRFLVAVFLTLGLAPAVQADPVRIKDLVEFDGVRGNDLVGYGLVVSLNGTGDGLRNNKEKERRRRGRQKAPRNLHK